MAEAGLGIGPGLSGAGGDIARNTERKTSEVEYISRMVNCVKLGKEAEGLATPPYPGELGKRIFEQVSQEAWKMWLGHQTMLINEYRLTPIEPEARAFLEKEMEKYFFGEGSAAPQEYTPPT